MEARSKDGGGALVRYWEKTVPWTFKDEKKSYHERRRLRYDLQDYMAETIPFGSYEGKRVLEIGSGSGIDSAEFGRNGADVVSLDFTETGAETTRDTLVEAGVPSNVLRAAAQHLPFRDGVFDCVYSFGVLHHIPEVGKVLKEICKKLAKRGQIVLMLYNRDSLLYAYSILFLHREAGLSEAELVSRYSERIEGCPHTKAYTRDAVQKLLAGDFQEISTAVHFDVIDTPELRKVRVGLPEDLGLGWHIIAIARKKPRRRARKSRPPG